MLRITVIALFLLALFVPSDALAAYGQGYGPWFASPGSSGGDARAYRAATDPASSAKVSEITDFACYVVTSSDGTSGRPLSKRQQTQMAKSIYVATSLYGGQVDNFEGSEEDDAVLAQMAKMAESYRNSDGQRGVEPALVLQSYLRAQQQIFRTQGVAWTGDTPEKGDTLKSWWEQRPKGNGTPGGSSLLDLGERSATPYPILASAINTKAANPLQLTKNFSEGCGFDPLEQPGPGGFGELIGKPTAWFEDLLFYLIGKPVEGFYNLTQPLAFKYTFWTPHVEQGDTIFNTNIDDCRSATGAATGKSGCKGTKPLGFNVENINDKTPDAFYIKIAFFLQWLLSGTYFIIMFAAAIVYMVRGSKSASLNVLQVIPRIILAVILTMFGPWLIGIGIFISNTFIQALFQYNDQATIGSINSILSSASIFWQGSEIVSRLMQVMTGAAAAFFFAFFLLMTLVRNLALILIVALLPLGCFCLIIPAWQARFGLFVRMTVAVIAIPAIMAFIMKIGLAINPLVWAMEDPNATEIATGSGVLGLFMLIVMLWLMTRAVKIGRAYATGGGQGAVLASGMGNVAGMLNEAGLARGGMSGRALRVLGQGAAAGSAASYAGNEGTASMVPQHKGMLASSGNGGPSALSRGLDRAQQKSGMANGNGFGPKDMMNPGDFMQKRFTQHMNLKQASSGERRISPQRAQMIKMQEKQGFDRNVEAAVARKGAPLNAQELKMVKNEFYNGKFKRDHEGRIMVSPEGDELREDRGWHGSRGVAERRGGGWVMKRDKESFNGQSKVSSWRQSMKEPRQGGHGPGGFRPPQGPDGSGGGTPASDQQPAGTRPGAGSASVDEEPS